MGHPAWASASALEMAQSYIIPFSLLTTLSGCSSRFAVAIHVKPHVCRHEFMWSWIIFSLSNSSKKGQCHKLLCPPCSFCWQTPAHHSEDAMACQKQTAFSCTWLEALLLSCTYTWSSYKDHLKTSTQLTHLPFHFDWLIFCKFCW